MRAEDQIQAAIVEYIRTVAPDVTVYAIPNAARRTASGKPTNAVPGLLPGAFDLGLVLPGGRAAFIEVKTKTGNLSKAQWDFYSRLELLGASCFVCRSVEDAREALAFWGVSTREAAA